MFFFHLKISDLFIRSRQETSMNGNVHPSLDRIKYLQSPLLYKKKDLRLGGGGEGVGRSQFRQLRTVFRMSHVRSWHKLAQWRNLTLGASLYYCTAFFQNLQIWTHMERSKFKIGAYVNGDNSELMYIAYIFFFTITTTTRYYNNNHRVGPSARPEHTYLF